jgi:hypothetical protein
MGKIVGKPAVKNSAVTKEKEENGLEETFNADDHITFLEKALKRLNPKTQSETIEQIEYQIAQLKSGS